MATILDGKKTAARKIAVLREKIEDSGLSPHLATVIAGTDPASQMSVRMKHKACEQVGITSVGITLPENAPTRTVVNTVLE